MGDNELGEVEEEQDRQQQHSGKRNVKKEDKEELSGTTYQEEVFDLSGDTGSRRYMAPEVALSEAYNEKADVYSFAFIFHEMLTGCQPFENLNLVDFYTKVVLGGERPDLEDHPVSDVFRSGEYASDLASLLESCWSKSIYLRPNFQQIVMKLEELSQLL